MSWTKQYAEKRGVQQPDFKAEYEAEATLLALVRARQAAALTQEDVARALHVSQPYIAQIERGTRPVSLLLLVRYANVVGAKIEVARQAS